MARTFIEDPPYIKNQRPGRIDYIGFGLMALALGAVQLVLDKGQEAEWFASSFITWVTIFSVITAISFVIWELRSNDPIVDLRVLVNRNFAVGTSLMVVMGIVLYGTIALLPLFLQTLLGYPAVSSGMAVSPRGFGAIVSMLIVGRLIGKVNSRYLIMFGFAVLGYSTYQFGNINLEISISSIVWPSITSGFAMGFIFVPLTTMALGTLSNEQMGNASGVFNLMRNSGGSIGIATVTTLLARGAQVHQAAMVSHLTPYDPAYQERLKQMTEGFAARGGSVLAGQQAYAGLYGTVVRQAMLLSYIDVFRLLAFLCLLCIPATLLFKQVRAKPGSVAMH
jgi:DHA2 family multidrug resistance protein